MLELLLGTVSKIDGISDVHAGDLDDADITGKVMFMNSVFDFFGKGMYLEQKGLNPKVSISW